MPLPFTTALQPALVAQPRAQTRLTVTKAVSAPDKKRTYTHVGDHMLLNAGGQVAQPELELPPEKPSRAAALATAVHTDVDVASASQAQAARTIGVAVRKCLALTSASALASARDGARERCLELVKSTYDDTTPAYKVSLLRACAYWGAKSRSVRGIADTFVDNNSFSLKPLTNGDIAGLLWACSTLQILTPTLLRAVTREVLLRMRAGMSGVPRFTLSEVATIAWVVGQTNKDACGYMRTLSHYPLPLARPGRAVSATTCLRLFWAFARVGHRHEGMLQEVQQWLQKEERLKALGAQDLSLVVWSCVQLEWCPDAEIVGALDAALFAHIAADTIAPQDAVTAFVAASRAQFTLERSTAPLAEFLAYCVDVLRPEDVSAVVTAFADIAQGSAGRLLAEVQGEFVRAAQDAQVQHLSPNPDSPPHSAKLPHLLSLNDAVERLGEPLDERIQTAMDELMDTRESSEFGYILEALERCQVAGAEGSTSAPGTAARLVSQLDHLLPDLPTSKVPALVAAIAASPLPRASTAQLLENACGRASQEVDRMSGWQLAQLLTALGKLKHFDKLLLIGATRRTKELLTGKGTFGPSEMASVLGAFVQLDWKLGNSVCCQIEMAAIRLVNKFPPSSLCVLLTSFHRLNHFPLRLLKASLPHIAETMDTLAPTDVSGLVGVYGRFRFKPEGGVMRGLMRMARAQLEYLPSAELCCLLKGCVAISRASNPEARAELVSELVALSEGIAPHKLLADECISVLWAMAAVHADVPRLAAAAVGHICALQRQEQLPAVCVASMVWSVGALERYCSEDFGARRVLPLLHRRARELTSSAAAGALTGLANLRHLPPSLALELDEFCAETAASTPPFELAIQLAAFADLGYAPQGLLARVAAMQKDILLVVDSLKPQYCVDLLWALRVFDGGACHKLTRRLELQLYELRPGRVGGLRDDVLRRLYQVSELTSLREQRFFLPYNCKLLSESRAAMRRCMALQAPDGEVQGMVAMLHAAVPTLQLHGMNYQWGGNWEGEGGDAKVHATDASSSFDEEMRVEISVPHLVVDLFYMKREMPTKWEGAARAVAKKSYAAAPDTLRVVAVPSQLLVGQVPVGWVGAEVERLRYESHVIMLLGA